MKRLLFILFLLSFAVNGFTGDVAKDHTWVDGETPTAALWNANEDEVIVALNDIEGENLATDIAITTTGNAIFSGTFTTSGNTTLGSGDDTITLNPTAGVTFSDKNITNVGDIALDSLTPDGTTITVNDDGSNGNVMIIDNDGTNHGLYITQDGAQAASKYGLYVHSATEQDTTELVKIYQENVGSAKGCLTVHHGGSGAVDQVMYINNASTGHGLYINPGGVTAAGKYGLYIHSTTDQATTPLAYFHQDNASSAKGALELLSDGSGNVLTITANTAANHIFMTPHVSTSQTTEGGLFADDDGVLYYFSNSALAPCNTAADFSEIMQQEGNKSTYEIGDVIVMGTENIEKVSYVSTEDIVETIEIPDLDKEGKQKKDKNGKLLTKTKRTVIGKKTDILDTKFNDGAKKVKKSTIPYDMTVIGVYSDRTYILPESIPVNDRLIVVGLIGLVRVNVCDEGGNIQAGDPLVTSSKEGYAMKGTIDTIGKMRAVFGKAREDVNFTTKTAVIEMIVGVK